MSSDGSDNGEHPPSPGTSGGDERPAQHAEIRRLLEELALAFGAAHDDFQRQAAALEPVRPGPAIDRRPRAPLELDERPLFVVGVSTWNRESYIRRFIESFVATRSQSFNWALVVADDGSTDGTLDYLESVSIPECQVVVVKNKRRTIAGQANAILQVADALGFDFGMKCDDDIFFTSPGWDRLYYEAAMTTGVEHLVYHNSQWKPARHDIAQGRLHSSVGARDCLGCLYTFTPAVIETVGFMDGAEFEFRGHSHIDFTVRCCRAGFNDESQLWDAASSGDYVGMWSRDEYVDLVDWSSAEVKSVLSREERSRRMNLIDRPNRVFVPATTPDHSVPRSRFILSPSNDAVLEALQVVPTLESPTGPTAEFDGIFVINLDHDVEKWAVTAAMLVRHGLDFERFPGIDGNAEEVASEWREYASRGLTLDLERKIKRKLIQSPGAWGYLRTMESLLTTAKERRLNRILVFDDDIMVHREFADAFDAVWPELPAGWKLVYLGRSQVEREAEVRRSEHLVHPRQGANGSFAIALDASIFDLALEEIRQFEWPFDSGPLREIDRRHPDETLAAEPPLVVADVSESAIRRPRNTERFAERHGWAMDQYEQRCRPSLEGADTRPPLVSVIVVCEREEPTIGDALRSLRRQTHGRLEILAVLSEPSARTAESLARLRERDSRIRILSMSSGGDEAGALNAALSIARGEILVVHAPTEVSATDRIEQIVTALETPDTAWVAAPAAQVDALPPGGLADPTALLRWIETAAIDAPFTSYRVGGFRRTLLTQLGGVMGEGEVAIRELVERASRWPRARDAGLVEGPMVESVAAALLFEDPRYSPSVDLSRWKQFHVEIAAGVRPARVTPPIPAFTVAGRPPRTASSA